MNRLRSNRNLKILSVFSFFVLLGCTFSGISIRYRTPPRSDPPPFSLQGATYVDPASPTVFIFSPSPSKTGTATWTPTFTLTASLTDLPTGTWTPLPTWTSLPTAIKTNTRIFYPTFTRSRTVGYIPVPSATWLPTWTSPPTSTSESNFVASQTGTSTPSVTLQENPGLPVASDTPTLTASPGPSLTASLSFTPSFTPTITFTARPSATSSGCNIVYNSGYESQIITLVNNQRTSAGLPALSMHNALMTSARGHSVDMALNNYMSHTGSDGSTAWQRMQQAGYVGRWGGENIWVGYSNGTPEAAMSWWMNSTAHRDNILGQYYRDIGVGYAYCSTGTYRHYYSINFGAP